MQLHREIGASAEAVWRVVGERFGDLTWSDGIDDSHLEGELGVGGVRVCRFPPNAFSREGLVRERLTEFDREARVLAYVAENVPGVMRTASNRWTVVPLGPERCRVEMRATIELRGIFGLFAPLLAFGLRRMGDRTLRELEGHVAACDREAVAPA